VNRARETNVTFFPIDLGGLDGRSSDVETLRTLAEETDGSAFVNSNEVDAGFRRFADEISAFYVLGYYPADRTVDGKYRSIEVRVRQPDVTIAARRGYFATARARGVEPAAPAGDESVARALEALARLDGPDGGARATGSSGDSATTTSPIGAPVLYRGPPSPRSPLQPTATAAFRRGERLRVEWTTSAAATCTARLLDRRGAPLPAKLGPTTTKRPDGTAVVGLEFSLSSLAVGDYVIELLAVDAGSTDRSLVAFRVTP
jgi:hypothetical protein